MKLFVKLRDGSDGWPAGMPWKTLWLEEGQPAPSGFVQMNEEELEQSFAQTEEEAQAYAELKRKRLRFDSQVIPERDALLIKSDFCILPDSPFSADDKAKIALYRKALRDMGEQRDLGEAPIWPTKPACLQGVLS